MPPVPVLVEYTDVQAVRRPTPGSGTPSRRPSPRSGRTRQIVDADPRSTCSHWGSLAALDQRVPALPSTAADAGYRRSRWTRRSPAGPSAALAVPQPVRRERAVHRRTPRGSSRTPVARAVPYIADVAAGAGDGEGLRAAGAGGGRVHRRPGRRVGRHLDLERGGVRGLPREDHLADRWRWQPRSTWSHWGSAAALDQRVPALPSTAADAGVPTFSEDEAVAGLPCDTRVSAALAVTTRMVRRAATTVSATAAAMTAGRRYRVNDRSGILIVIRVNLPN